jgi:hypothetical protein
VNDAKNELLLTVPAWLARWSATEGWIGFAPDVLDLDIWLNFYASGGHAYAARPGERPEPLAEDAPAFTATLTSDEIT